MHLYRRRPEFRCLSVLPELAGDLSEHRWTLDTLDDYRFLYSLYDALGGAAETASLHDVLAVVEQRPELRAINAHVTQKA